MQYAGQKLGIDIDIVGDPYWLFFATDHFNLSLDYSPFPHIAVYMKSFYEYDGMNSYREDPLMELNTLYMIDKIESTFDRGSFKQHLHGIISTPFIQATRGFQDTQSIIIEENASKRPNEGQSIPSDDN